MNSFKKSRRHFLKAGGALAAGAVIAPTRRGWGAGPAATPQATKLEQLSYADVQLLDGPMLEQFRQNHALFLNLNEDSLQKPFRPNELVRAVETASESSRRSVAAAP